LAERYIHYSGQKGAYEEQMAREIDAAQQAANDPGISWEALRELAQQEFGRNDWARKFYEDERYRGHTLFPDLIFRQERLPRPEDYTNLPRFWEYEKIGVARNVYKIRTCLSDAPDPVKVAWDMKRQQKRYKERMEQQKAEEREAPIALNSKPQRDPNDWPDDAPVEDDE